MTEEWGYKTSLFCFLTFYPIIICRPDRASFILYAIDRVSPYPNVCRPVGAYRMLRNRLFLEKSTLN